MTLILPIAERSSAADDSEASSPSHQVKRTTKVRAFHALGFESGFIVIGVSIVAWVLNVSLLQAFPLEIGFFLFFYRTRCCTTGHMMFYVSE